MHTQTYFILVFFSRTEYYVLLYFKKMSWRIVSVLVNQNKSYEIFSHISLKLTICMYMSVTTTTSESYYRQRRVVRGYIAEWRCCNPVNFYIFSKRVFFLPYNTNPMKIYFCIFLMLYREYNLNIIYTYLL